MAPQELPLGNLWRHRRHSSHRRSQVEGIDLTANNLITFEINLCYGQKGARAGETRIMIFPGSGSEAEKLDRWLRHQFPDFMHRLDGMTSTCGISVLSVSYRKQHCLLSQRDRAMVSALTLPLTPSWSENGLETIKRPNTLLPQCLDRST
jgi:hypothetical protein